jgi:defect in organelle trafficking protein DotD
MNYKILTQFFLLAVILTGCSGASYIKGNPQLVAEPDKVSALLADAADRASTSLEKLAAIEAQKNQQAPMPQITDVPRELHRGITVSWIGPAEPILQKLSDRVSYNFMVYGQETPNPLIVSIDAENQPIIEVLKSIGLQLGSEADLHVNAETQTVELRYKTKFQNLDNL